MRGLRPRREAMVEQILWLIVTDLRKAKPDLFRLGRTVSERQIVEALGSDISRTPVREALALLVHEGVLEQRPQVGIRLPKVSKQAAIELMSLRRSMEELAVRKLATSRTDLEPVAEAIVMGQFCVMTGREALGGYYAAQFHEQIAALGGYWTAARSLRGWHYLLRVFAAQQNRDFMSLKVTHEHEAIYRALEEHDGEMAAQLMSEHLQAVTARLL